MASKSPQAFRTIREVADWLEVEAHVLRFWESKFSQIKPVKRAGGRRYYRPADMRLVGGIKHLLHDQGLTIRGVQKLIREEGVAHVSDLSPALDDDLQGDLVEAESTEPVEADAPASGFFDVTAMAGEEAQPEERAEGESPTETEAAPEDHAAGPEEDAQSPEPAPEDAPEPEPAAPIEVAAQPDPATDSPPDSPTPLTDLHTLITQAGPLDPEQSAALAPHLARLEALADRLTARSRVG